jgi:TolB-like protein/DNA-binding winged helix-turn-helix (wHTH) protein/Tfp pilus assembly protein PilF
VAAKIRIGDAHADFSTLSIEGPAGRFSMEPKVMNLLQVLVDNVGDVVSRADLLDQVWGEHSGGDESLSRAVSLLRRAFGEVRGGNQYIETVPKRGYRLAAKLATEPPAAAPPPAQSGSEPEIRTASSWSRRLLASPSGLVILAAILIVAAIVYLQLNPEQAIPSEGILADAIANEIPATTGQQKSIAVLPFEDLSSESDQQYFADGLAEEILNALVRFPELRVVGRKSSFTFRDPTTNLGEINSALAVSHVLTGSLRKQGSRVRITARIVQTKDGSNLWSDSYDGDINDIFDLQEEIARQITKSLGVVLDLSAQKRFARKLTDNRQAYDLFLQGRAMSRNFGHRNKTKAKELLGQAVSLDPNFAAAWAWLAQANLFLTLTAQSSQIPGLVATARGAVNKSLALDPDLAMGHYVRTILLDYDLDFAESMASVEKANAINPSQPFLAIRRGNYHAVIGRSKYGSELMEQGLLWDPTDSVGLLNLGIAQLAMGQIDRATTLIKRSDDLGFVPAAGQLCMILKVQNLSEDAYNCWISLSDNFRNRYSPVFQNQQQWLMLGRASFLDEPLAQREATKMLNTYFSEPGSRANTYLLQMYLFVGGPKHFMQTFVSHPYPLNSGAISGIWDDGQVNRKLRQHPDFPAFAEHIGLLKAWQKYGWPDRCQALTGTDGSNRQFSCD